MPNQHLQSRGGSNAPEELDPTSFKSQQQHILDLLTAAGGAEVPLAEILVCAAQYNRCIYDLRKRGYKIMNRAETRNGVKCSWYRLESAPPELAHHEPSPLAEPTPSRKKSVRAKTTPSTPEESLQL
jgi:hypothetical protein